jgi:hypothetical protein
MFSFVKESSYSSYIFISYEISSFVVYIRFFFNILLLDFLLLDDTSFYHFLHSPCIIVAAVLPVTKNILYISTMKQKEKHTTN